MFLRKTLLQALYHMIQIYVVQDVAENHQAEEVLIVKLMASSHVNLIITLLMMPKTGLVPQAQAMDIQSRQQHHLICLLCY